MRWMLGVALALTMVAGCGEEFTEGGGGQAGTPTGTGASGAGTPQQCATPAECSSAGPCATPTCINSTCGIEHLPPGTPLGAQLQLAGDCQTKVCDGLGNETSQQDPQDPPDDLRACTDDYCDGLTPHNEPLPEGTPCGDGDPPPVCNAAGQCVGCVHASDCAAPQSECKFAVCASGVCEDGNDPYGTETSSQLDGDCLLNVCDGDGYVTSVPDDNDKAPDVTPHDCAVPGCSNGVPMQFPLPDGSSCGAANDRVCCLGVCCQSDWTCGGAGCQYG